MANQEDLERLKQLLINQPVFDLARINPWTELSESHAGYYTQPTQFRKECLYIGLYVHIRQWPAKPYRIYAPSPVREFLSLRDLNQDRPALFEIFDQSGDFVIPSPEFTHTLGGTRFEDVNLLTMKDIIGALIRSDSDHPAWDVLSGRLAARGVEHQVMRGLIVLRS